MGWVSDQVSLKLMEKNSVNEQIVLFRHADKILVCIEEESLFENEYFSLAIGFISGNIS